MDRDGSTFDDQTNLTHKMVKAPKMPSIPQINFAIMYGFALGKHGYSISTCQC